MQYEKHRIKHVNTLVQYIHYVRKLCFISLLCCPLSMTQPVHVVLQWCRIYETPYSFLQSPGGDVDVYFKSCSSHGGWRYFLCHNVHMDDTTCTCIHLFSHVFQRNQPWKVSPKNSPSKTAKAGSLEECSPQETVFKKSSCLWYST